jgi:hypothetical protein
MSNGDGYRSPKSNVPNASVRFAGIAPTPVTKGQLSDQVGNQIADNFRNIVERSLIAQTRINLGEEESEIISGLNVGSSEAVQAGTAEEVEEIFERAQSTAQERVNRHSGSNKQILQTSLNRREGLLRAGQISPTTIGLLREKHLAKREKTFAIDMQVLSNSSDIALFDDTILRISEQTADAIATGTISELDGSRRLRREIDISASTQMQGMFERGEYGLALSYLASPEYQNVSPDVAGQWSLKLISARSNVNKGDILEELRDPHSGPFNHWMSEEGLAELQEQREAVPPLLTEDHYQTIMSQRRTMVGNKLRENKDDKKTIAMNASIANMLAQRSACESTGRYDCPTYSSMVREDDENFGPLLNFSFSQDYKDHQKLQGNIGQPALSELQFMGTWIQTNNKIPPVAFETAVNNVDLKVTPTAEEKSVLISQLNGISAVAKFAPAAFEDIVATGLKAPGKTIIEFWRLFNVKQYGPDGDQHIEGGRVVRRLDASDAYDLASQELNAGFEAVIARRDKFEAQIMVEENGVQVAEILALEAYNRVSGTSNTAADLGIGRLTTLTRIATVLVGKGGMNAEEAYAQAARQLVTTHGHGWSNQNINDKEAGGRIRINAPDNPMFDSINNISALHPNGVMLDFGNEPLKSDLVLDFMSRLEMALSLTQDNDLRDKAVILKELTAELANNTRFTTGHAWDTFEIPEGTTQKIGSRIDIDFNDPSQVGKKIIKIEGSNTLKSVMQIWADRTGMELDDAYNLLSIVALGRENLDGNYWEPSLVGDNLTRTGVTDRGGRNSPSWVVEAQYPGGALPVPVTWGDTFTPLSPFRKDFSLEPAGPGQTRTTGDHLFPMKTIDGRIGGFTPVIDAPASGWQGFPTRHPMVKNDDGSKSNVVLSSFWFEKEETGTNGGKEIVIPTMVDGKPLEDEEAIAIAREHGLDKYPQFGGTREEAEEAASKWAEKNHGNIDANGRLRGKQSESKEPVYLIPTIIDGEQLNYADALKYAKSLGLENYPDFENEDKANSWLAQHEGLISDEGVLYRAVSPSGFRRGVQNPIIIKFDKYQNGMSRAEQQKIMDENATRAREKRVAEKEIAAYERLARAAQNR